MKLFSYPKGNKMMIGKVIGKISIGYTLVLFLATLFLFISQHRLLEVALICMPLLLVNVASIYVTYQFPNIETTDDGLRIEFILHMIKLSWEDIVELHPKSGILRKTWLVETKGLTKFHILYGIHYGPIFSPCFLIWPDLQGKEDLIREIKSNMKKTKHT